MSRAKTWLDRNFVSIEVEMIPDIRTLLDTSVSHLMERRGYLSCDFEDTFWLGTEAGSLVIPGLRITEDGEGRCIVQLPVDPGARDACLTALYDARSAWPVPISLM